MWVNVYVVGLLKVAENDFVSNLIGIYGECKTELIKCLDMKPLKMSNWYSSTDHSTFWILISPAPPVTWNIQLYIQARIYISLFCSVFQRRFRSFIFRTVSPLHLGEWPGLSIPSSFSSSCRSLVRARWDSHQLSSYQNGMSAGEVWG